VVPGESMGDATVAGKEAYVQGQEEDFLLKQLPNPMIVRRLVTPVWLAAPRIKWRKSASNSGHCSFAT
jgi:hypothetical protein